MELYLGINKRFFSVQGTIMDYEFTKAGGARTRDDETLEWTSQEGVVMAADTSSMAGERSVQFLLHFERWIQLQDRFHKIEVMRPPPGVAPNGDRPDELPRTLMPKPSVPARWLKQQLLPKIQGYMKQSASRSPTSVRETSNIPTGTDHGRQQQITALDSTSEAPFRPLEQGEQANIDVGQAKINADKQISEAKREESAMLAESSSLAEACAIGRPGRIRTALCASDGRLVRRPYAGRRHPVVV